MGVQQRRALILGRHYLFAASLRSLLQRVPGLEVVVAAATREGALGTLGGFRPQVVILEEGEPEGGLEEREIFAESEVGLLVRLSLDDNAMELIYKRRVVAAQDSDLLGAIRQRGFSMKARRPVEGSQERVS